MKRNILAKIKSTLKKKSKPELKETDKPVRSFDNTSLPIGNLLLLFYHLSKRGIKGNYILDVGAHSTDWIRLAKKAFPESVAYLIEPLLEMEQHLKKFCDEFPGSKYFLKGAGANPGKLYLTLNDVLEGANFLQSENNNLKQKDMQREVEIITIDSLINKKEMEIPEIVKLDVQGFELEVLKGATKLFGRTEIFILEVSLFEFMKGMPVFSEVISFMGERGYEVYDFPGFLRRPYDGSLGQIDVCFVKRESMLRETNNWYST